MTIRTAALGLVPAVLALSIVTLANRAGGQEARPQPSSSQPTAASQPPVAPSGQRGAPSSSSRGNATSPGETRRLPEDSTTKQTITVGGRTLSFTATAGSLRLFNQGGDPQADIAYTAYQLDGSDPRTRPVTFFFNGGPGASSAYLQLGAAGPWRIAFGSDGVAPSPELKPNGETWLDFSDLVFVDPVGTGYSRFVTTSEEARKKYLS